MILRAAFRELLAHPARTLFAVAGVAVSGAMLLDMLMLSNGMQVSFRELLRGAGYEIRVSPVGTFPLDTEATIPDAGALADRLRADPEIASVAPVLAANLALRGAPGTGTEDGSGAGAAAEPRSVFALGVDPAAQGVFRLTAGRLPGAGEVLVGERFAEPGDTVRLAPYGALGSLAGAGTRELVVSGTAEFIYVSESELPVALPLDALQRLTGREDENSFLMLAAAEGVHPDTLASRLAGEYEEVRIISVGELVAQAERRLSYFRQLAIILGTVSLIVAALLIGTIASVSISDRYGTIAAARAIGISRRSILLTLLAESVVQSAVAVTVGVAGGLVTSRYLERILSDFPGLPEAVRFFVPDAGTLAITVFAILGTAAVASLVPAWRVTRMPIATTLHREEP